MKKTAWSFVPVLAVMLLSGCSGMFEMNMFGTLEDTKIAIDSNTSLDTLLDLAEYPNFFAELVNNPEQKAATITNLETIVNDPAAAVEDKQEASLLIADIVLNTNPSAQETVSNIVNVVLSMLGLGSSSSEGKAVAPSLENAQDIILEILPESARPPEPAIEGSPEYEAARAEFQDIVQSLYDAGAAYEAFGENLVDTDGDGELNIAGGINTAGIAQLSVVCILMNDVADRVIAAVTGITVEEAAGRVFDYLAGVSSDPIDASEAAGLSSIDFSDLVTEGTPIYNIMTAAGLDIGMLPGLGGSAEA